MDSRHILTLSPTPGHQLDQRAPATGAVVSLTPIHPLDSLPRVHVVSLSPSFSPWITVLFSLSLLFYLLLPFFVRFLFLVQVACNRAITGRQARNSI